MNGVLPFTFLEHLGSHYKEADMAKATLKDKIIAGLLASGFSKLAKQSSSKAEAYGKPGTATSTYHVGTAGSLRMGATISKSVPALDQVKANFIENGEAALSGSGTAPKRDDRVLPGQRGMLGVEDVPKDNQLPATVGELTILLGEAEEAKDTVKAAAVRKAIAALRNPDDWKYEWRFVYIDDTVKTVGCGGRYVLVEEKGPQQVLITETTGEQHTLRKEIWDLLKKDDTKTVRNNKGPGDKYHEETPTEGKGTTTTRRPKQRHHGQARSQRR